jgi:hypothetical protein
MAGERRDGRVPVTVAEQVIERAAGDMRICMMCGQRASPARRLLLCFLVLADRVASGEGHGVVSTSRHRVGQDEDIARRPQV